MSARRFILLLAAAATLEACGAAAGTGDGRAAVIFKDNCGVCHGAEGQGTPSIGAPAIAGLPVWYVSAQLNKFRDGIRGAHADDEEGLRMRPMARTLEVRDVEPVAAYVASLAPAAPDRELPGNAEAGKASYTPCLACHGPDGKGNEALKAPPIVQLDDWYIQRQLHKFRSGIRGVNPKDVTGGQMRPMALTLKDEQAISDVIAYVGTLSGGK
ncbi:MAG TPA: c-type cytochrome [Myxococcota bacterium]|nr:c-type cytochrome [Myxococcota bacterium]